MPKTRKFFDGRAKQKVQYLEPETEIRLISILYYSFVHNDLEARFNVLNYCGINLDVVTFRKFLANFFRLVKRSGYSRKDVEDFLKN